MPSSFGGLQFRIAAAVLTVLVLLAALNEFLRTAPFPGLATSATNLSATFLVFILTFWYIRRQTRPLRKLTKIANKIADGDLATRADEKLKSELGALAEAFNKMADQLTEKIQRLQRDNQIKKEFISIMTHNLQTPLAIIRGYLDELLEEKEKLTSEQVDILKSMEEALLKLGEMNSRLLTTIELQGEVVKLNRVKKDLAPVAGQVVKALREQAEEKQIALNFKAAREPLIAEFDEEWIKVVFENLLDNALKYTPKKGKVTVRVGKTSEGEIFGEVEDTGVGIPKDMQEKVLLPFHHSPGTKAEGYGVGVGLYIVRLVVEKHGGRLELESEEGKGTKIRFVLPAAEKK